MKLVATLDDLKHAHLLAYLWCSQFTNPKPVHFMVDSGCSITTILNDDATRLGLNCATLQPASAVNTANGHVVPYIIPDVILIFDTYYGPFNLRHAFKGVTLRQIHCHQPTTPSLMTQRRVETAFSLLGMDFLQLFKTWKFSNDKLCLIK